MGTIADNPRHSFAALRQFVRKPQAVGEEKCELCAKRLGEMHDHLLELANRHVVCACEPCAILFSNSTAARYRRIPRQIRRLASSVIDDHEWNSLLIPINLAFFVHSSSEGGMVAQYPSPAGTLRSELDLEYWTAIVERSPVIKSMEPDVEALLVNRVSAPSQYFLAPIDHCYRLSGVLRTHWRGFSGGQQVWQEVDRFFADLKQASFEVRDA